MLVEGGAARRICEGRRDGDTCVSLTPDDTTQVLRTASGRLVLRKTSDGSDVPLTIGAGEENAPFFSPDGRVIAFASNRTGRWLIYAVPLDRAPVQDPLAIGEIERVPAEPQFRGLLTESSPRTSLSSSSRRTARQRPSVGTRPVSTAAPLNIVG